MSNFFVHMTSVYPADRIKDMDTFRILIIVLASDTEPLYCKLQAVWRNAKHPRADILFLKAHPDIQGEDFVCGDTIYIGCRESLDNVYEKQMRGFKLLVPLLSQYAFVFRTNLSSYVDIPNYLHYCATLPRTRMYGGLIGHHDGHLFASGSGYTITPDLIERLVQENPPEVFVDDVSVGSAITSWGVPILEAPRDDYTPNGWIHKGPFAGLPAFHRRVKTEDRNEDVRVLALLFQESHYRSSVYQLRPSYHK